jgi:hypothetical protein
MRKRSGWVDGSHVINLSLWSDCAITGPGSLRSPVPICSSLPTLYSQAYSVLSLLCLFHNFNTFHDHCPVRDPTRRVTRSGANTPRSSDAAFPLHPRCSPPPQAVPDPRFRPSPSDLSPSMPLFEQRLTKIWDSGSKSSLKSQVAGHSDKEPFRVRPERLMVSYLSSHPSLSSLVHKTKYDNI